MNSASQNFSHHLGVLRERLLHATDYDQAMSYFLDEFAGDGAFVRASDPEQTPHLKAVLSQVVSGALSKRVEVEGTLVSHLREHRFYHGNGQADGRIVIFFYFATEDVGMMMLMPSVRGQADIGRFRLNGVADPQTN
jgi:hypothetical protein